jgi:hypothetical protein
MKKSRYTDSQIMDALKRVEAGIAVPDLCRGPCKKVVRPSRRREMAKRAVVQYKMPVKWACQAFSISETCYRYEAKLNTENDEIAD